MIRRVVAAGLGAALVPGCAAAQLSHASVTCVLSATPLNFGAYSTALPAPAESSATLVVTCTTPLPGPVPVSGSLSLSYGRGSATGTRRMSSGHTALRYQIYADTAHSMVWGDGSDGTQPIPFSGTVGRTQPLRMTLTAHGRLLARQGGAAAGSYNDVLTVTLTY